MEPSKKILIWGAKSQARLLEKIIQEQNLGEVKILYDSTLRTQHYESTALRIYTINILKNYLSQISHFVVAVGSKYGFARYEIAKALISIGKIPLTITHRNSFIDSDVIIGEGAQILSNATISNFVKLGQQVILNTSSVVDHESIIGNGVHVMGGANITGEVLIEDCCTIGTNATILPRVKVGYGSLIGAGAVVTRDVKPNSVMVGIPAKSIGVNEHIINSNEINELIKT
jgi:sugar O-acyltransferase (sialic acid O-acetyltransferase NeuD family)